MSRLVEIEDRLVNWGRWSRAGSGLRRGRCASAERMYVMDTGYRDVDGASELIDFQDAERIEALILGCLSDAQRRLCVLRYVHQALPSSPVIRRICSGHDVQEVFRLIREKVQSNELQVLESQRIKPTTLTDRPS